MERILLNHDPAKKAAIMGDLSKYKPLLTKVHNEYLNLHIGEFTNEIFKDSLVNGTTNVNTAYRTSLELELDKTWVHNPNLRQTLLSQSGGAIDSFKEALTALLSYQIPQWSSYTTRNVLDLQYIDFVNNQFVITPESEKQIEEQHCNIYLNNPEEQLFYNVLETLANAYNGYLTACKTIDPTQVAINPLPDIHRFLTLDPVKVTVIPDNIGWAITAAKNKRDADAKRAEIARKQEAIKAEYNRKYYANEFPEQIEYIRNNQIKTDPYDVN